MDAASNNIKQDSIHFAASQMGLVLFFVVIGMPDCCGQHLAIRSRDKNQEIIHDLIHDEQFFEEVQWDIHNSIRNQGVAVIWTAEAFETIGSAAGKNGIADTGLAVRIQHSGPPNAWKITQQSDLTRVAEGDRSAMVSAFSSSYSEATFGIIVMFHRNPRAIPVAGRYQTTMTGTIAAQ